MIVCLVSRNADLLPQLLECGEITILHSQPEQETPQADLYVWDVETCIEISAKVVQRETAQHLVVATPESHNLMRSCLPESACILLKPVAGTTLRAFIALAASAGRTRIEARRPSNGRKISENGDDPLLQSIREITSKLQQCDPQRDIVIARAVHDFRGSLTALNGYCRMLMDETPACDAVSQAELIRRMRYSINRLGRLSADVVHLLSFGSIKKPAKLPTDGIETCLQRALSTVRPLLEGKHISVKVALEPQILLFESDQMERLFIHLLENSCKFTPESGSIEIKGYSAWNQAESCDSPRLAGDANEALSSYRIDITDSGDGITTESAATTFDLYAPSHAPDGRAGGGLALAICKLIVNAHAGAIWAAPKECGGQISFILPVHRQTKAEDKALPHLPLRVN